MHELDPTITSGARLDRFAPPVLPGTVRTFGFVPDLSVLKPGDLILTRRAAPRYKDNTICWAQEKAGFSKQHAKWTHAAIYAGDDEIVEATFRGINRVSLYSYIPTHCLRVRRDESLTDVECLSVVLQAMRMLGKRYSITKLPKIGRKMLTGYWRPPSFGLGKVIICSSAFADAHIVATKRPLLDVDYSQERVPLPATLSSSRSLQDVKLEWISLSRQ